MFPVTHKNAPKNAETQKCEGKRGQKTEEIEIKEKWRKKTEQNASKIRDFA